MKYSLIRFKSFLCWGGIGLFLSAIILSSVWLLYYEPFYQARKFPKDSEAVLNTLREQPFLSRSDYSALVAYFTEGFLAYATPLRANASYPGYRSVYPKKTQQLEGFSRIAPLLAVWLKSSPNDEIQLPSGRSVNLVDLLANAVNVGTDPASPEYWGTIENYDQRIAEASDIALSLWFSKDRVWKNLSSTTKGRIVTWLISVNGKRIADNNWHLFVVTVNTVLKALDQPYSDEEITSGMDRIKAFYQGDGWFRDGLNGPFDYYNAWGFHYQLNWIHLIDPTIDPIFIETATAQFAKQLIYLIGPQGFPIMGRSVCYRLAVTAPLMFAAQQSAPEISLAQAKRALDATWQYFLARGAVKEGRITQGYCTDDPRVLDGYSGPASCLWSLRSLIATFAIPAESDLWTHHPAKLPVELADYDISFKASNLRVIGTRTTGEILIVNSVRGDTEKAVELQPYTFFSRIKELVIGGIRRPDNESAKYQQAPYSSLKPFCPCDTPLDIHYAGFLQKAGKSP